MIRLRLALGFLFLIVLTGGTAIITTMAQVKDAKLWLVGAAAVAASVVLFANKVFDDRWIEDRKRRQALRTHLQDRFRLTSRGRFPLAEAVSQRALELGVHRIRTDGEHDDLDDMTPYIFRDAQVRVDAAIDKRRALVVIHGESSVGKSRLAFEAVQRKCARRSFVWPKDTAAVVDLLKLGYKLRDAVVWIDNLQPEADQSWTLLRELPQLIKPEHHVTVLMSMWTKAWQVLGPGGLNDVAEVVYVDRWLTGEEKTGATKSTDPRIQRVLQGESAFAEELVAGPAIYERWQAGRREVNSPAAVGAATVSAAVDLWRAGLSKYIPGPDLGEVYRHYLDPAVAGRSDLPAFDEGLTWATALIVGASSCLEENLGAYRAFDYLIGQVPQENAIPEPVQDKALQLVGSDEWLASAANAIAFGQFALAKRAAMLTRTSSTDPAQLAQAAFLLGEAARGQREEKEAAGWYEESAKGKLWDGAWRLGLMLRHSEVNQAKSWLKRAADAGHAGAAFALGGILLDEGDAEQAKHWLGSAETLGHDEAGVVLAGLRGPTGAGRTPGRDLLDTAGSFALPESLLYRPTSLNPTELGFTPQRAVAWLAPRMLFSRAILPEWGFQSGSLDRRELQLALPAMVHDSSSADSELWFDFIADAGDGFDATYSIAYLLAQNELEVGGFALPRGSMLLAAGNRVFPHTGKNRYRDRFLGPYQLAMPVKPLTGNAPALFALPGSNDSYDGSTEFLRTFCRRGGTDIGGWRTKQSRSYSALRLPHRWWLLMVDCPPGSLMDDPQLEFFRGVAATMLAGDDVIAVLSNPAWVLSADDPDAYEALGSFIHSIIVPSGASLRVVLAGGMHHYARYESSVRTYITCGGAGAFVEGTEFLPERLVVPPRELMARTRPVLVEDLELKRSYPTVLRSRWLTSGIFSRLPWQNPSLFVMLGAVHTALMLTIPASPADVSPWLVAMAGLVMAGCISFSLLDAANAKAKAVVLGILHGLAHLLLGVGGAMIWWDLPVAALAPPLPAVVAVILYLPTAGVMAELVFALFLLTSSRWGVNRRQAFSGQAIEDFKSFLRMHISSSGELTIHTIGLDSISKKWVPHMGAGSMFRPARPLRPRLVDEPLTFAPTAELARRRLSQ